ncbi:MAG: type II toxin-antitoxin system VapC family toxin [Thaumarchaeota archaeon]|jgi:predicted nucleic acid-binding protein|nr:type II toxin-antitoxin system VapC family toxin [Nitrososphaerota archaeon]
MNYDFVIDSYAWIEYFIGSKRGFSVKRYVEEEDSATPTIVVAEISRKLMNEAMAGRETATGREDKLDFIKTSTLIVDLTEEIARLAGEIAVERRKVIKGWGIADSIILATARKESARVVTGDKHFADLRNEAILI